MEHGHKVSNPGFEDYAEHFEALETNLYNSWPEPKRKYRRTRLFRIYQLGYYKIVNFLAKLLFSRKISLFGIKSINDHYFGSFGVFLDQPNFKVLSAKVRYLLVFGYGFRDWANMVKHQDQIRAFFKPNFKHQQVIDQFFQDLSISKYDVMVGIHIRRGDYREFKGGKYYFEDDAYCSAMRNMLEEFPDKNMGFLICSNEEIDIDNFSGYNVHLGPGHFIQDLSALAKCDYIIGPHSTYSFWACFFGNNRISFIEKDINLSLDSFKKWHEIKI